MGEKTMEFLMTETEEESTESMLDAWVSWLQTRHDPASLTPDKVVALTRLAGRLASALHDIRNHCQDEGQEPEDAMKAIQEILHKVEYSWKWKT